MRSGGSEMGTALPLIEANCPACVAALTAPYILLGAAKQCRACNARVAPRVVGTLSDTGIEITFAGFLKLLTDADSGERARSLVALWFPEVAVMLAAGERPASGSAEEAALLRIHCEIQSDRARQSQIYNAAMSVWR